MDFQRDACKITTAEIQSWLDRKKLAAQNYENTRRVLHLLFAFAVARGYAADNPVAGATNSTNSFHRPDRRSRAQTSSGAWGIRGL